MEAIPLTSTWEKSQMLTIDELELIFIKAKLEKLSFSKLRSKCKRERKIQLIAFIPSKNRQNHEKGSEKAVHPANRLSVQNTTYRTRQLAKTRYTIKLKTERSEKKCRHEKNNDYSSKKNGTT